MAGVDGANTLRVYAQGGVEAAYSVARSDHASVGEVVACAFSSGAGAQCERDIATASHATRALAEVLDELRAAAVAAYREAAAGGAGAARARARLEGVLAAAGAVADAKARVAEASYGSIDAVTNALDARLELMGSVLHVHREALTAAGGGVTVCYGHKAGSMTLEQLQAALAPPVGRGCGGGGGGGGAGAGGAARGAGLCGGMDLDVQESEPLYCTCRQVAFGEMIACDGDACAVEWYHLACVGLSATTRPHGAWLCPACGK